MVSFDTTEHVAGYNISEGFLPAGFCMSSLSFKSLYKYFKRSVM